MEARLNQAFETICEWSNVYRIPCWRIDHVHRITWAPDDPTLAAFATDPELLDALAAAAATFEADFSPYVLRELAPGATFIFFRERDRRHSFGWVVSMAPTREAIPALAALCSPNAIDSEALRASLHKGIVIDRAHAEARADALTRAHASAMAAIEYTKTIDQFTVQLTQAYETSCMSLRISRMMTRINEPEDFIRDLVTELHETSEFGWVAFVRHADQHFDDANVPHFCTAFDTARFDNAQIRSAGGTILAAKGSDTKTTIVEASTITSEALGPELIIQPLRIEPRTIGLLILGARNGKDWAVNSYDTLLVETTAASLTAYLETVRLHMHQQKSFLGTLRALTAALDAKDHYTRGHSERVAFIARQLAAAVNLLPDHCRTIHIAGLVHDIGKIGVPESVLTAAGKPTTEEFARIRQHPVLGHDMLREIPMLRDTLPGILHHHERWDGKGYPSGLKGNAIPRMARILALADAFDAMSSNRTYDAARGREEVLAEIRNCRGTHFDPELTDAFLTLDFSAYDAMLARDQADTQTQPTSEPRTRDRAA